jgi:hypothetical protein
VQVAPGAITKPVTQVVSTWNAGSVDGWRSTPLRAGAGTDGPVAEQQDIAAAADNLGLDRHVADRQPEQARHAAATQQTPIALA